MTLNLFRERWLGLMFVGGVATLIWATAVWADVGRGRHKRVYVVPRAGPVKVDADLGDWDLSGQIWIYVVSETAEMQSARYAMMYDSEALYISGVVRDPSPMMNRHDPNVDPDKAWDADVCQIFMTLDPSLPYPVQRNSFNKDESSDMCTLLLWYYTDRQEPNLVALKAMLFSNPLRPDLGERGVIPRDRYQAAFRKAEDGRGYTFEYRIPWNTLGVSKAPRAGDMLAGTVCFFWGTPDGLKTAGGSAWAYDVMGKPGFPFQSSDCWGRMIFTDRNNLPREMVEEGVPPEPPLPLTFEYDLPEDAQVTIQLHDTTGRVVRILAAQGERRAGRVVERWDGLDATGKVLPAGRYAWKGLYHQPIRTKFILSAHNSGQPPYKTDDNTGGWGGDHGISTTVCPAGDTMLLAWNVCESGWGIIRTDLAGKKIWGSKHCATHLATDGQRIFAAGDHGFEGGRGVKVFDLKDCRPLNFGNGQPELPAPAVGDEKMDEVTGLACGGGVLYAAYKERNLVAAFDALSGTLKASWPVPAPGRMALRPDGSLAVISGGEVAVLKDGKVAPWLKDHLDEPRGIAVAADGTVYVANAGRLQAVTVFDASGRYVKMIGKEGGRPRRGRYESDGILEPGGIGLDGEGRLWVAETLDGPKRQSVWDTKTGALVREFFGASAYFGWAWMDPGHPDELYCHNVLWKVDLTRGACVPYSTIWRATDPNMIRAPTPDGYGGHFRVITARNGRQFGWGMVDYSHMLYIREGDVFKPFAGTIRVAFGQYGSGIIYPVMKDLYEKTKAGAFLWQDRNDDQIVQEEELVVSPTGRGENVFNWIDEDLNAWCDAGWIYRPVSFREDGRPVYDFSKTEPIPFRGHNSNAGSLWLDPDDGGVYTLNPGQDPGLAKWTRDGRLIWGFGGVIPWNEALNLPMIKPGALYGLTMPLCIAGEFTGAACYFGPYHIFTRDGLYVAMVMRDGRSGGLGPDITASEVVTGQIVKPDGMNRYFLLAGDQDGRVTEILGLDTVKRLPGGMYEHTEESVKQVVKAQQEYAALLAKAQRLVIGRGRASLDGAAGVSRILDERRGFQARAAWDDRNLYLAFDVTTPCDLVNDIADPKLVFKGGNCLDIQIATDASAEASRTTPAPGDVRMLVTRQNGETLAVLYRPRVRDAKDQPIVLSSPTGQERFDRIEVVKEVALDVRKTAEGFSAVVAIPLSTLGWTPRSGAQVRMDLGYIFGNETGNQVAARLYWNNSSFSSHVTYDIPSESRLEPAEWGTAFVE